MFDTANKKNKKLLLPFDLAPFQPSVANQMTDFYVKCNTEL